MSRSEHDRTNLHRGTDRDLVVVLTAHTGELPEGADLHATLVYLNSWISDRESGIAPAPSFKMNSILRRLRGSSFAANAVIGAASGDAVLSVLVERTSTQSVSSNPTEIVWDGTIYDPDGWSDIGGSFPSRLTAPSGKGGKVFIASGSAEYGGAAAAYLQVKKNGTDVVGMANAFNAYVGSISVPVYLDDGDYVELLITNVTGNDIIQTDAPTTFGLVG